MYCRVVCAGARLAFLSSSRCRKRNVEIDRGGSSAEGGHLRVVGRRRREHDDEDIVRVDPVEKDIRPAHTCIRYINRNYILMQIACASKGGNGGLTKRTRQATRTEEEGGGVFIPCMAVVV